MEIIWELGEVQRYVCLHFLPEIDPARPLMRGQEVLPSEPLWFWVQSSMSSGTIPLKVVSGLWRPLSTRGPCLGFPGGASGEEPTCHASLALR